MMPHSIDEERRLILLAQAGDEEAFCALARERIPFLLRSAAAFGCDRSTAEDLTQETLFEAWRSLGRFDGRCRLATWLFGILRNRWLKSLRKRPRGSVHEKVGGNGPAAASDSPDSRLKKAEESAQLRQALFALPENQRRVLELRFFGQASLDEIAVALDCPLGTVKSRLHHGLAKLSQHQLLRQLEFD